MPPVARHPLGAGTAPKRQKNAVEWGVSTSRGVSAMAPGPDRPPSQAFSALTTQPAIAGGGTSSVWVCADGVANQ